MTVTINANGLSIIHKGSGGEANATLPDVCATTIGKSTVNIAYGNNAKSSDLVNGTTTITADGGHPIAIKGSKFSKSTGDEGGDKKGVSSGTIQGEAEFISGSPTVLFEGKGVCRLSDQMTMNSGNTMCLGGAQNPSIPNDEVEKLLHDLTIKCRHPDGILLKNATFSIIDESGAEIQSGQIDESGQGKAMDLSSGLISIKITESANPFEIDEPLRQNNPYYKTDSDNGYFFELVTKGKCGFWQKKGINISASTWGDMPLMLTSSMDFNDLVLQEVQWHYSHYQSQSAMKELANDLITAIDVCSILDTKQCIARILPSLIEEGDILAALLCLKESETANNVFAFMRHRGKGNPQNYLKEYNWTELKTRLNTDIDALLQKIKNRISWLQEQAERCNYAYLASEVFTVYLDKINVYLKKSPDYVSSLVDEMKTTVSTLIEDNEVHVIKSPNSRHASEGGGVELVVNTTDRVDVVELGWKPVQGDFPLLVFETKNKMDTFCHHKGSSDCKDETICPKDMRYGDEDKETIESYGAMTPFKDKVFTHPLTGVQFLEEDQFTLPASEHFKRMNGLADDFLFGVGFSINGDTSKIYPEMVARLQRNEGGYYDHPLLTDALKYHETTAKFHGELIKCLSENVNEGALPSNITNITSQYMRSEEEGKGASLPQFLPYDSKGIHENLTDGTVLSVHGIWSMKVYADNLEFKDTQVRGLFKYQIQDHFGLDVKDIDHKITEPKRWYEQLEGFRSWYLLQHFEGYGYKPFITKIDFEL
ncbi:DUF3289 family protein [Aliivibrio finisterrensis]|uniref:DUF3289 family protein n=1 Tax=Aliivibrio finisterrensis TaxID=511998 RepID=A0ABY0I615_9GAMM|nr:DUF3289 family protein [Aliivibrio finisterrensis]RYU64315.1 DUF3289 family protein [Aliivibrio finisterrensis]RYU83927.1 DUF3289 family protein [Aliivibrio finisterrensis]